MPMPQVEMTIPEAGPRQDHRQGRKTASSAISKLLHAIPRDSARMRGSLPSTHRPRKTKVLGMPRIRLQSRLLGTRSDRRMLNYRPLHNASINRSRLAKPEQRQKRTVTITSETAARKAIHPHFWSGQLDSNPTTCSTPKLISHVFFPACLQLPHAEKIPLFIDLICSGGV